MLNVSLAYAQAEAIRARKSDLINARNQLQAYKSTIDSNWQASEVNDVNRSLDAAIDRINRQIKEIDSVANDIRTQAQQIRAAQEAEARRQAELAAARQRAQQKNEAKRAMDAAAEARTKAEKALKDADKELSKKNSKANQTKLKEAKNALDEAIKKYEESVKKYNSL